MKKSILNIISLMCCLTIMLTATSCGNNAKKEEIVVDGIIPLISESELILRSDLIIEGTVSEIMDVNGVIPIMKKVKISEIFFRQT